MEDTLKNANDLEAQAKELRSKAVAMRERVVTQCEHRDLRLESSFGYYEHGILVTCDECQQYALFAIRDSSRREDAYGKARIPDANTFLNAIRARFKSDGGFEGNSLFAELLAKRVQVAREGAFIDGVSAGMKKAVELMNREQEPEWLERRTEFARDLWQQTPAFEK